MNGYVRSTWSLEIALSASASAFAFCSTGDWRLWMNESKTERDRERVPRRGDNQSIFCSFSLVAGWRRVWKVYYILPVKL